MDKELIKSIGILVIGIVLAILTRLMSNYKLKKYYLNTNQGDPIKLLPKSISLLNVLGAILIIIAIIWGFTIKIWIGLIFIAIYFLIINLIPAELIKLKKVFIFKNAKRCKSCKKFYEYSYFALSDTSDDGHVDTCVACNQPDVWKKVQEIKKQV